ncbi:MAG: hypothetical protein GVY14_10770 [Spirochaetes bacterium]|jgi:hypothetical protein|nr:hypothetical protein [Spirochaetota bacterium]
MVDAANKAPSVGEGHEQKPIGKLLLLASVGGFLNFGLGTVAHELNLPFFIDSVLTIVVTLHLGLIPGLLTAVLTNGLLTATGQVLFPFVVCNIATAAITHLFVQRRWLGDHAGFLWLGLAVGVANGLLGSIASYLIYQGVTDVHGIDALVMSAVVAGQSLLTAVFWAGMLTNIMDKVLSAVAAYFLRPAVNRLVDKVVGSGKIEQR